MKASNWFAADVTADRTAAEAVEFAFNELDSLGTEIDTLGDDRSRDVVVIGYFDEPPDDGRVRAELASSLAIYGLPADSIRSVTTRAVENADWLAEWKKHWRPTRIGRFVIAPPWSEVDDQDAIVIRIEPNMAFGTGTHETTQMCIAAIDSMQASGRSFLDVGTGTGILSIAAAKVGFTGIDACDTDEDSIAIARENAVLNGVGDSIRFADGPIDADTPVHDVVCANLTWDVIEPILPQLIDKAGDELVLSGILASQEPFAREALAGRGHSDVSVSRAGEWIALRVQLRAF